MSPHLQEIAEQCKLYDGWFVREENIEKFAQTLIDQVRGELTSVLDLTKIDPLPKCDKELAWQVGFQAAVQVVIHKIEKRFGDKK
jgi:hypothetical protein